MFKCMYRKVGYSILFNIVSLGDASNSTQHTESVFFHVQITLKRAICLFNSIFENKHLNPLLKY